MHNLRFKVGELAGVMGAHPNWGVNGNIVEVLMVGPWGAGERVKSDYVTRKRTDYIVSWKGQEIGADDNMLFKLGDPDQQEVVEEAQEIELC